MSKLWIRRLGVIATAIMLAATSGATDLYEVTLTSQEDAATLRRATIDPLLRIRSGYLVLTDEAGEARLAQSRLLYSLVASDIDRAGVVMDIRKDDSNVGIYPLIFEQGGLRLYRFDVALLESSTEPLDLARLQTENIPIVFPTPPVFDRERLDIDLDSAIALIRQDSLESYGTQLESFGYRLAGYGVSHTVRNWLMSKFSEFGYDSVVSDEFLADVWGQTKTCHNVVAYKIGSVLPQHHIVIGAHRDVVPGTPGADDNGSGTCSVLELARVLAGFETQMTFVFILFDAEEPPPNLQGSWHYANNASARGDSITFMINLDMIGHYENEADIRVYYDPSDSIYHNVYAALADTLEGINLTAHMIDHPAGWDDGPFYQNGYGVLSLLEYIWSTAYHQANDSTVNLNYEYMTRVIRALLGTVLVCDAAYETGPMILFSYPDGTPDFVYPEYTTSMSVNVVGYAGAEIILGTGQLHYLIDSGAVVTVDMTPLDDTHYEATLPALPCGSTLDYYFSVEESDSGVVYIPDPSVPFEVRSSTGFDTLLIDNFEGNFGWTVTGDADLGMWERGYPLWFSPESAPTADFDSSGQAYLTDTGHPDVDGGATILTSPPLASNGNDVKIHYARWYSNHSGDAPFTDSMLVEVYDGTSWHVAEIVGPVNEASGGWIEHEFWVSEFITPPESLFVRFVAADEGEDSNIEAAIDAVLITQQSCRPVIITPSVPDWTQEVPMIVHLNAAGGTGSFTWLDESGQLDGSGLNLATDGWLNGIPLFSGPISFTATATDENDDSDERLFSFIINLPIEINTSSLPDGIAGEPYAVQLESSGGTDPLNWQDVTGDLNGTGLTLSGDGLITGLPTDTGTIDFTARVEDAVGGYYEQPFGLIIEPAYICGDIDHNAEGPDISDLVYLVDYMFAGGPAPPAMEAADVDGSGGNLDIADLVYLVDYMFTGGPPLDCS